jgi:xylulose-5-phosphate/fructose-6-phosphate phosphoketolase
MSTAGVAMARQEHASWSPAQRAVRYWRATCALASAHLLGTDWPPPGRVQRTRVVGHWGCNPGIAWATGHLAAQHTGADPLLLIVGTGHAASFGFAHDAAADAVGAAAVSAGTARYGQPGGEPSERLGVPGVPYLGGELGAALGVSQGLAAGAVAPIVCCVIGDGECETPAALAAFAHADVLLRRPGSAPWLPVVNANGSRMGAASRWSGDGLARLLGGMGYDVFRSGTDGEESATAARQALTGAAAGRRTVWISETPKGWPAPESFDDRRYRGAAAHKAPTRIRRDGATAEDVRRWFTAVDCSGLLQPDGSVADDVAELARRVTLRLGKSRHLPSPRRPSGPDTDGSPALAWRSPATAVDTELAERDILILSPDEASSNGLRKCGSSGRLVEVLAEETCAAWAWGSVEAGQAAAFATYEAFAPLSASMMAQYLKLVQARPSRAIPPLLVLATSLSWANAPSHQNTDLTGVLLARDVPQVSVVYPVGAGSAAARCATQLDDRFDGVSLVAFSKQAMLDLPDPGSPAVRYRVRAAPPPTACIVAVGDVCATEAVAAAVIAAEAGIGIEVLALIDLTAAAGPLAAVAPRLANVPLVGGTCTAAAYVTPLLWHATKRVFPVAGYAERYGPTAWETLRANRLDRYSLLAALRDEGMPFASERLETLAQGADRRLATRPSAGVLPFDCPALDVDLPEDL